MKKIAITLAMQFLVAITFLTVATAQEYSVSVEKSSINWRGTKVVSGGHEGTIDLKSGVVTLNEGLPATANIVIDMASLSNTDLEGGMKDRLVGHLKSEDFFGVEKFPLATMVLVESRSAGQNQVELTGDLTIKEKTHQVTFVSKFSEQDGSVLFEGEMKIDRTLYDVKYGSGKFFDNLGDRAINDIFTLEFKLYLMK